MQKTRAQEARQNYRHQAKDYYLVIDRRSGEIIGRLLDISMAGFRMVSDVALEANSPLEFQLSLPHPIAEVREIPLEATVRWSLRNHDQDCFEIGCQLHEVSATIGTILTEVLVDFEGR